MNACRPPITGHRPLEKPLKLRNAPAIGRLLGCSIAYLHNFLSPAECMCVAVQIIVKKIS
jgi:hypothetical protein